MAHAIGYPLEQASRRRTFVRDNSWLSVLSVWYQRYMQRQELRELDDHLMADVGLSRAQADAEARKPFWVA